MIRAIHYLWAYLQVKTSSLTNSIAYFSGVSLHDLQSYDCLIILYVHFPKNLISYSILLFHKLFVHSSYISLII